MSLRSVSLVALGVFVAAACTRTEEGAAPEPHGSAVAASAGEAARIDADRWLGEPLALGNLVVWPVHSNRTIEVGEFLTLDEALAGGLAEVREVGAGDGEAARVQAEVADLAERLRVAESDAAREAILAEVALEGEQVLFESAMVNRVVVENRAHSPLLLCAGTVVQGGQQDRQIARDVVVAAGATLEVDAYCVEPGRWSTERLADGEVTDTAGRFLSAGMVSPAKVRSAAQYVADQEAVWERVGDVRAGVVSGISATAGRGSFRGGAALTDAEGSPSFSGSSLVEALVEVPESVLRERKELEERIAGHFARTADGPSPPVGLAYAVNGRPVSVRTFAHPGLLSRNLPSFARAMVLEAEVGRDAAGADAGGTCTAADVTAFVRGINAAEETRERSNGASSLAIRESGDGWNSNCYLETPAGEVPLTQDWTAR